MTLGSGGHGASSRSNSRNNYRAGKYSTSRMKLTGGGSSIAGTGGSHPLGGHPLKSADQSKRQDIKHRFEITKKLGSGTYGKVSLAYDHKTERDVAVKLIKKSAIENKADLIRIRREIRIMSALQHPNIIQIYEVFENKDKIILVMEYACGGELYDYVSKNGSLPEHEARRIFRQITSAVLYCHKHKVAHRDLKLENILLDTDNNAKIADFGLSNYFDDKRLLTTFCGSPLYASPEIINGTPYKGPEVDCWSLGILLYTLVYGSMPFDGRDFNRMVRQIKRGAYYEPDTPSTASMLIRNMLRVNPDRRADIDDIASHWWLNLEENMPVIQELPENQITDHTPLTEREETMVVQDLADETDVFMEFGHLSSETRKKIEEFRRRRKEAEEYNENSPIKPPKSKKINGNEEPEMTSKEKSLRDTETKEDDKAENEVKLIENNNEREHNSPTVKLDDLFDPLERLRQLENRLNTNRTNNNIEKNTRKNSRSTGEKLHDEEDNNLSNKQPPAFTSVTESREQKRPDSKPNSFVRKNSNSRTSTSRIREWSHQEIDSLNMLMNQVLEQMEKGPVSLNTVARIKGHPHYDQRPMVKELLESILAAQPPSVQKQASKIIQQQSKDIIRKQMSGNTMSSTLRSRDKNKDIFNEQSSSLNKKINNAPLPPEKSMIPNRPSTFNDDEEDDKPYSKPISKNKSDKHKLESGNRPWHSVEVGFESDNSDEKESENESECEVEKGVEESTKKKNITNNDITEITVQDTSFEDVTDDETQVSEATLHTEKTPESRVNNIMKIKEEGSETDHASELEDDLDEDYGEDEEEELDSDIEELADVVEQTVSSASNEKDKDIHITIDASEFLKKPYNSVPITKINLNSSLDNQKNDNSLSNNKSLDQSGFKTPAQDSNYLNTFDRGLIKRQSKGKYQLNHIDLYGRGVSTESETPSIFQQKKRIGGPQPPVEQCPILFDKVSIQCPKEEYSSKYPINMKRRETAISSVKQDFGNIKKSNKTISRTNEIVKNNAPATTFTAKKYIMQYPNKLEDSDDEKLNEKIIREKRQQSAKVQNTQKMDNKSGNQNRVSSLPPRSPPPVKSNDGDSEYEDHEGENDIDKERTDSEIEEEDEETEEFDDEFHPSYKQVSNVIGFKTNEGSNFKNNPTIQINNQPTSYKSPTLKNNASIQQKTYTSQAQNSLKNVNKNDVNTNNARKKYTTNASLQNNKECKDSASKISSKNSSSSPTSFNDEYNGMQKWETAAAYIRRKNRERRQRNQTIAITEEAYLRAKASFGQRSNDNDESNEDSLPNSPSHNNTTGYNYDVNNGNGEHNVRYGISQINLNKPYSSGYNYQSSSGFPSYTGNSSPYSTKKYDDYHYTHGNPHYSGSSYLQSPQYGGYRDQYRQTNRGIDRRKSFHEMTPERDYNDDQFGSNFGFDKYRYSPNVPYQPANTNPRHYEEEFSSSSSHWSSDPKRYPSYHIPNDSDIKSYGSNNIRPFSNNWNNNSVYSPYGYDRDRPISNYMSTGVGGYHRSTRHEDNYNYPKRNNYDNDSKHGYGYYDYNNSSTPYSLYPSTNIGGYGSKVDTEERSSTKEGIFSRLRPVTKRIASVLGDDKTRPRSQSNDRKFSASGRSITGDEHNEINRHPTPELSDRSTDYPYINYHDSATGGLPRMAIPKEPDINMTPGRGILKNKTSSDVETRKDSNTSTGGATSGVKHILSRIRRRISFDKSVSPAPTTRVSAPITYQNAFISNVGTSFDEDRRSHNFEVYDVETAARKRQLSNINRRRTCDIRMGPDGKFITNTSYGGIDDDYKRPRSPIEKIKSFFRKTSKESSVGGNNISSGVTGKTTPYDYSSGYSRHDGNSSIGSAASSRYTSGTDKIFGSFPTSSNSSRLTSNHGSSQYNNQGNKYTPVMSSSPYTTGGPSSRYTPSTRNWHDDSHHY
ncbi:Protein kinase domain and Serine/threonine-/dual specificity protein kinase, catalytic domain and Protein kinase-like domain-containing protein [Strongyloides ratti]|uniref:Protein kinase domain and Serine/threonine-/dual specificity protein kinase, catalytic domain and Protein kinase-like domain-containing protein n=1 Tax=Strongyloides ratti TaxID=34506 RepID=A0A090KRF2_STRRB|nr:Protein kinase domain and Serine/threonine-/dual specificity protein kinase, catalytic domain and Protein kinase-like domain-containing protein [Strongyloides ratti]CEF60084.1 Protein kinase domain and Serine/threonine-/dual specificity protein kinase, catalytic domain and Protein kinase-like domain-containing protein [Strongyloides ratti]